MSFLLGTSFVIDVLNEIAAGALGPALQWLNSNPHAKLWISDIGRGLHTASVKTSWLIGTRARLGCSPQLP
jgi:hypothetical protein